MKHIASLILAALLSLLLVCTGCNLCPTAWERERVHNPFPQLKRVAVLPFFNQSGEPTLDSELVAEKYYAALQAVPGFEVLPVGVTKAQWLQYSQAHGEPVTGAQFQDLARFMGVEAVIVGSVTDFDSYYPPRMAMTVHWYAANEGFHPIPPGYGLPWGTKESQQVPDRITREAEFELARSQLATQTPRADSLARTDRRSGLPGLSGVTASGVTERIRPSEPLGQLASSASGARDSIEEMAVTIDSVQEMIPLTNMEAMMPADWPDPTDLIPDPPGPHRPDLIVNHEPVLSQTRLYRGDDPDFTIRLANYVETNDDARPASWQGYLKRSDDFIHFCCHLHIMEMLESRGGREQSDLILRWPLSRY